MKLLVDNERNLWIVDLEERPYTIGRGSACDIQLNGRDLLASRRHARVYPENGDFFLEDLGSSHGTFVNEQRLEGPCRLRNDDIIRLGNTLIKVTGIEERELEVPRAPEEEEYQEEHEKVDIGDQTRVISQEELYRLFYKKLVVISPGDLQGTEFPLNRIETVIGRKTGDIQLPDESVSSPHAVILRQNNKYFIADKGSTNGTMVNGEPVVSLTELRERDTIQIGRTNFFFVDQNSQPEAFPARGAKRSRKGGRQIFWALVILLLGIGGLYVAQNQQRQQVVNTAINQEIASLNEVVQRSRVYITMQTADDFFQNRMWEEALAKYEEVQKEQPDYPGLTGKIDQTRQEMANKKRYQEALLLLEQGKVEEAEKIYQEIPETSVYSRDLVAAIAEVKRILKNKKTQSQLKQAQELYSLARKAYLSGNTEVVLKLLTRIENLKLSATMDLRKKARTMLEAVRKIPGLYQKGLHAFQNGQSEEAIRIWTELISEEQKFLDPGGKKSFFARKIAIFLVDDFYHMANMALKNGQRKKARDYCSEVLQVMPDHKDCKTILQQVSAEAAP